MSEQPLLFERSGQMGIITLNAPKSLNSLTAQMCQDMAAQLTQWSTDATVYGVLIQSNLDKALCAGGDVVSLYHSMKKGENYHRDFFRYEYHLDLAIHQYPKPIVVFANGIVMGGGIGITNGASHRVVTETTRMAMPEITIGFFPDVGGSYFLGRMPRGLGKFLGLTGARLNAADTLFVQMADHFVPKESLPELRNQLLQADLSQNAREAITGLISAIPDQDKRPKPQLEPHGDTIEQLMTGENIHAIKDRLASFATEDRWLQRSIATFLSGSPTSMAVILEQISRGQNLTLEEAFAMEAIMARQFTERHDMQEGVRSLLIDKDQNPQWSPKDLSEVTPELVQSHFGEG